jgi:WhiB family redox-sensing transcriptional regulator
MTRIEGGTVVRPPAMAIEWKWGWRLQAACRGEDPSLFFAPSYFEKRREKEEREAKAKRICARCRVREPCLEYSVRGREPHGIWGGLNEFERRQLVHERTLEAG